MAWTSIARHQNGAVGDRAAGDSLRWRWRIAQKGRYRAEIAPYGKYGRLGEWAGIKEAVAQAWKLSKISSKKGQTNFRNEIGISMGGGGGGGEKHHYAKNERRWHG